MLIQWRPLECLGFSWYASRQVAIASFDDVGEYYTHVNSHEEEKKRKEN